MKKKPIIAAIAVLAIVLIAGSSIAYFNSQDTADNVFTVGDVKIQLTEDKWKPDEDHLIQDGTSYDKNPVVTNIGKNPAFIRIHVKISDYEGMKAVLYDADPSTIFTGSGSGYDSTKWKADAANPKVSGSEATYTYYYYKPLAVEASTEALFEKVIYPDSLNQDALSDLSETFSMEIYADAVQSEGFVSRDEAFHAFDNQ